MRETRGKGLKVMGTHKLKLNKNFVDAVYCGQKNFEIRLNDRGYQTGDFVEFVAVDNLGITVPHMIESKVYKITYVLNGWGLKEDYVAFGIKECGTNISEEK